MRVRLTRTVDVPGRGLTRPGTILEVPTGKARAWVRRGSAEIIDEQNDSQTYRTKIVEAGRGRDAEEFVDRYQVKSSPWFDIPVVGKVRGRDKAIEALQEVLNSRNKPPSISELESLDDLKGHE